MAEGVGGGPEFQASKHSRLDWLSDLSRFALFRKPEVLGKENLFKVPISSPLVIATSHFSDVDLLIVASALRSDLQKARPNHTLGISLQAHNLKDPASALFINLVGKKHFFKIDAFLDKTIKNIRFLFNPENFRKMADALEHNTDMVIAAHKPLSNIPNSGWELPSRSGLGAAYLAQVANATVLPVAVDIQSGQPVGMTKEIGGAVKRFIRGARPEVRVAIGEPFILDKINEQELETFDQYIATLKIQDHSLPENRQSEDEINKAREVGKIIRQQGDIIMQRLAALLPASKRGTWT